MTKPTTVPWPLIKAIIDHTDSGNVSEIHITHAKIAITSYRMGEDNHIVASRDEFNSPIDALTETVEYGFDYDEKETA